MTEAVVKDTDPLVCVLCGEPWPPFQNACPCGGFCTWGPAKGADPTSWMRVKGGWVPRPVPPDVLKRDRDET